MHGKAAISEVTARHRTSRQSLSNKLESSCGVHSISHCLHRVPWQHALRDTDTHCRHTTNSEKNKINTGRAGWKRERQMLWETILSSVHPHQTRMGSEGENKWDYRWTSAGTICSENESTPKPGTATLNISGFIQGSFSFNQVHSGSIRFILCHALPMDVKPHAESQRIHTATVSANSWTERDIQSFTGCHTTTKPGQQTRARFKSQNHAKNKK